MDLTQASGNFRDKLERVLKDFPDVRIANPLDTNEQKNVLDFYNSSPIDGGTIGFSNKRDPNYFDFLKYQSDEFVCIVMGNPIKGVGTITLREGYFQGTPQLIGYLGDFRVAFERKALRKWRAAFEAIVNACDFPLITAVIDSNQKAKKSLVEQKKMKLNYFPLSTYSMINIFRAFPKTGTQWKCKKAGHDDFDRIAHFLDAQNRKRPFGYVFNSRELKRRLEVWKGLTLESFYLVEKDDQIVGCLAPFSPSQAKRVVLEKIPFSLRWLTWLGFAPKLGEELRILYLTHLEIDFDLSPKDRHAIFQSLLGVAYKDFRKGGYHMLTYCDFHKDSFLSSLRGYFYQSVSMATYSISPIQAEKPPGFEIAMV